MPPVEMCGKKARTREKAAPTGLERRSFHFYG
jgi:hypothetical protein